MAAESGFLEKIRKSILSNDKSIQEARNLDFVKFMKYTKDNLTKVEDIIKRRMIQELDPIPEAKMSDETLGVVKFYNQENSCFIATFYDNDLLWQDPIILNIFSFTEPFKE